MPTNNFVPVAAAAGSNVMGDASWNGSSFQVTGVQKGIVPSAGMNKAWRQGTMGTSALGQIIVDHGLIDAVDDGNVPGLKANLRMALAAMLAGAYVGVDSSATANTLIVILDPVPPSLSRPFSIVVKVGVTNTGSSVLSLNALGSKPVLRQDGTQLKAKDIVAGSYYRMTYDVSLGAWRMDGLVASDMASTSIITQISQALQSNIKTTVFSNATTTNLTNGAATAVVFADNSTPEITNNGAGTFTCYAPGAYLINFNTSIGTVLSSAGSNDVFARILINGVSTGFQKSPYYAPGASTFFQFVSVNLQAAVARLGTGDTIQMAAGVTVPSGFSSASSQGHVASFTRLF